MCTIWNFRSSFIALNCKLSFDQGYAPSSKLTSTRRLQVSLQKLLDSRSYGIVAIKSDATATTLNAELDDIQRSLHRELAADSETVAHNTLVPIREDPARYGHPQTFQSDTSALSDRLKGIDDLVEISRNCYYEGSILSISLWVRSAYRHNRTSWDHSKARAWHKSEGRSYGIHLHLLLQKTRRLYIDFTISKCLQSITKLSLGFKLSITRIVPWSAPIMASARSGDVHSMDALFRQGKAAPSDELADGTTLLHVVLP